MILNLTLIMHRYKLNVDEKVIQAGKFDMKTSASERQVLLKNILTRNEEDDVSAFLTSLDHWEWLLTL